MGIWKRKVLYSPIKTDYNIAKLKSRQRANEVGTKTQSPKKKTNRKARFHRSEFSELQNKKIPLKNGRVQNLKKYRENFSALEFSEKTTEGVA